VDFIPIHGGITNILMFFDLKTGYDPAAAQFVSEPSRASQDFVIILYTRSQASGDEMTKYTGKPDRIL
jgi:hypothetical protein